MDRGRLYVTLRHIWAQRSDVTTRLRVQIGVVVLCITDVLVLGGLEGVEDAGWGGGACMALRQKVVLSFKEKQSWHYSHADRSREGGLSLLYEKRIVGFEPQQWARGRGRWQLTFNNIDGGKWTQPRGAKEATLVVGGVTLVL